MKFRWYTARLRSMTLPEMLYRARTLFHTALERYMPLTAAPSDRLLDEGWQIYRSGSTPWFFSLGTGLRSRVTSFEERYPEGFHSTLEVSERLLCGEIHLFGEWFRVPMRSAWQANPRTGDRWPDAYWADIDTRSANVAGGVKWVWELNRHHHLVTLAKAFFLTGEERYAREVCEQLLDWIEQNPPRQGVNWASPLELAVRVMNWTWALYLLRDAAVMDHKTFNAVVRSIQRQCTHIEHQLSAYSSANNHLIGEASSLAFIGLAFHWLPNAYRWRQRGLTILREEVVKQILPDGVPAEQAVSYLLFILEFNLFVWRLASLNDIEVDAGWMARLDTAVSFLASLLSGRQSLPQIGDADEGRVVKLDDRPDADHARSILASAAVLLNRPDLAAIAAKWDEHSDWLLGDGGQQKFASFVPAVEDCYTSMFSAGGYVVLWPDNGHIVFDVGPLGYLSTAAHGHADALSIVLAVHGEPVLIDPGTYAYQEGGDWREFFRSTRAHNTVVVNTKDQSEMLGDFLWGDRAHAELIVAETVDQCTWVVGRHDGYEGLGVSHFRGVLCIPKGGLVVTDWVQGQGRFDVEQFWHFHPEVRIDDRPEQASFLAGRSCFHTIHRSSAPMQRRIVKGQVDPIQGWAAPRYGLKLPAPVISYSCVTELPIQIIFAVWWGDIDTSQIERSISMSLEQMERVMNR